jgi:hypothetical protein
MASNPSILDIRRINAHSHLKTQPLYVSMSLQQLLFVPSHAVIATATPHISANDPHCPIDQYYQLCTAAGRNDVREGFRVQQLDFLPSRCATAAVRPNVSMYTAS